MIRLMFVASAENDGGRGYLRFPRIIMLLNSLIREV